MPVVVAIGGKFFNTNLANKKDIEKGKNMSNKIEDEINIQEAIKMIKVLQIKVARIEEKK